MRLKTLISGLFILSVLLKGILFSFFVSCSKKEPEPTGETPVVRAPVKAPVEKEKEKEKGEDSPTASASGESFFPESPQEKNPESAPAPSAVPAPAPIPTPLPFPNRAKPELDGAKILEYNAGHDETLMMVSFKLYGDYRLWKKILELNPQISPQDGVKKGMILKYHPRRGNFSWPPEGQPYLILQQDTLQKISQKFYQTTRKWVKLWRHNIQLITHPDRIFPGFTLYTLPKRRTQGVAPLLIPETFEKEGSQEPAEEKMKSQSTEPIFQERGELSSKVQLQMEVGLGLGASYLGLDQTGALGGITGAGQFNFFSFFSKIKEPRSFEFHFDYQYRSLSLGYDAQNTTKKSEQGLHRMAFTGGYRGFNMGLQAEELPVARVAASNIQFAPVSILSLLGGPRLDFKETRFWGKTFDAFLDALLEYPFKGGTSYAPLTVKNVSGYGIQLGGGLKKGLMNNKNYSFNMGLRSLFRYSQLKYTATWDVNSGDVSATTTEFNTSLTSDFSF